VAHADRLEPILEAAADVLSDRGYYGTTMRDVATQAGVSLATLYHYVAGKDDLVYRVEHRLLDAAVASARAALAGRGSRERLKALLTDHIRRVQACPAEALSIAGRLAPLRGEGARRLAALRAEYFDLVQATLDVALRQRGRGRHAEERVWMLLGMAERVALEAGEGRGAPRPGPLATRVLSLYLDGAARPGRTRR